MYSCVCCSYVGKGWPLNYHLVLDVCALVAIITAAMTLLLPRSIENKRETIDEQ